MKAIATIDWTNDSVTLKEQVIKRSINNDNPDSMVEIATVGPEVRTFTDQLDGVNENDLVYYVVGSVATVENISAGNSGLRFVELSDPFIVRVTRKKVTGNDNYDPSVVSTYNK